MISGSDYRDTLGGEQGDQIPDTEIIWKDFSFTSVPSMHFTNYKAIPRRDARCIRRTSASIIVLLLGRGVK